MFCVLYVFYFCVFFFFKQKTAYEMRISDWSSDVCSSDLVRISAWARETQCHERFLGQRVQPRWPWPEHGCDLRQSGAVGRTQGQGQHGLRDRGPAQQGDRDQSGSRSEEHTSELQSLIRNSYAVFCLKKK